MKNTYRKIEDVFNYVESISGNSPDITKRIIKINNKRVGYIFLQSVSSDDKISNFLVRSLTLDYQFDTINLFTKIFDSLQNSISNSNLKIIDSKEEIFYYLASGFTIILTEDKEQFIAVETRLKLDRGVVESTTETVIRGPKDSFTENHLINMGLIRKRIKDSNLWFDELKIGKRTQTKVNIVYLNDVIEQDKVEKIKKKLNTIDIDGILDGGYIREFLTGKKNYLFPKLLSTERPDLVCSSLLEGKIVILIENSPFALIIPTVFVDFLHSPEDNYQLPLNVSLSRIIRFLSFILTIVTPAFYIAMMTYDIRLIPSQLLISLAAQRQGVPFPTAFEVILLLTVFEILRESDLRSPSKMGASISIVGALVLGDAAVSAGIVSPIAVIIVAITSVSGLVFSDIDMVNSIRIWRIIFLIFASFLGFIGIVAAAIIFITRLASIETLGTPYLAPLSPFNLKDQIYGIFKVSRPNSIHRPNYLHTKNKKREKIQNENS